VADIEEANVFADGVMLFEDAGILDGHVPTAEVDHLGAHFAVCGVERRGLEAGCGLAHEFLKRNLIL